MSDQTDSTIHQYSAPPPCLVCGEVLRLGLGRSQKSGKPFVTLRCRRDGRHYRAFIADPDFVRLVLARLEGQAPASESGDDANITRTVARRSRSKLERGETP